MTILPHKKSFLPLTLLLTSLTAMPTHASPSTVCPPMPQIQAEQFTVVVPVGARWDYATNLSYAGLTWLVHFNTWFENKVDRTNQVELLALGNHKFHAAKLLNNPIITTHGNETICRYSDTTEFYVTATSTLNHQLS